MPEPEPTLLSIIDGMGKKVSSANESHWHFSVEAPRWATRSPAKNTVTSILAGTAAFLLGASGFWLAWHAIDKLTGSKSATAVQIGPWAAVAALLAAAGVAVYAATGSGRLQFRITQLTGNETAAKALAASTSAQVQDAGGAEAGAAAARIGIAADHAASADDHATAAALAADQDQDAVPSVVAAHASAASAHASVAHAAATDAASSSVNGSSSPQDPATTISPKVWAGSIAGAVSFSFWTIATATFWKNTFSSDALAALVGSTTAIVSATAAYLKTDPLRARPKTHG